MRQAIYNHLTGDTELMTILSGGLFDAHLVGEISRQNTPGAFDTHGEIQPCGLLRMRGPTPIEPYTYGARQGFSLIFYEREGFINIELAMERAYTLLHDQRLEPVGVTAGCWEIHHTDDVPQQEDQALKASMGLSRFEAIIRRR